MSSKARRVVSPAGVVPFAWVQSPAAAEPTPVQSATVPATLTPLSPELVERDAFVKGFAQGERAGLEAAGQRADAMLRRLTDTLDELTALRTRMIHQTERQMVQLALAVARRIVHREISLDQDLLIAIARVALDRLGDTARITVRLNPEDFAITGASRAARLTASNVEVTADSRISRGGCRVESDLGVLDAGVDAQIQELARALLGEDDEVATDGITLA